MVEVRKGLQTLQAARGVAALCVVLFHANATVGLPKYLGVEPAPLFRAGNLGVHIFFVLSGLVMVLAHHRQLGQRTNPLVFFQKRFRRVYLPLWPVLAGVLLISSVVPLSGGSATLGEILAAFLILPAPREVLLTVEWTLRQEVIFYAVFGVLLWRPRIGLPLLGVWLAGSLVHMVTALDFPLGALFSRYAPLFAIGMIAGLVLARGVKVPRPALLAASGAGGLALLWAFVASGALQSGDNAGILIAGPATAALLLGLALVERRGGVSVPMWLSFLGDASYAVYLVHFPVVAVAVKAGTALHLPGGLIFVVATAGALAAGCIYHLAIERRLIGTVGRTQRLALRNV